MATWDQGGEGWPMYKKEYESVGGGTARDSGRIGRWEDDKIRLLE